MANKVIVMNNNYLKFAVLVVVIFIIPTYAAIKLFNNENSVSQDKTEVEQKIETSIDSKSSLNLGLTPEEFKNRYNKIAVQIDAPIIKSEDFYVAPDDDSFDFFGHMNYNIAVFGKIDSNGKITVLAVSTEIMSNYSYAFRNLKNVIGAVIYTFSPEISGSEVWNMVSKVEKDKNRYSELSTKKIIYGRMINLEDHESLMFMVKPKN
jgi:hypothetical protein